MLKDVKYQLIIFCPQNRATNVPVIKNGPNGISLFKPFFPKNINIAPITAPKKNAKNKATKTFGKPSKNPIKTANFTSPNPIQRPFEIKKIKRKNPEEIIVAPNKFKIVNFGSKSP